MERKKLRASLIALVAGLALSAGSAFAQSGVLTADPSAGKLIPYYSAAGNNATIIGIENVLSGASGVAAGDFYVFVHVVIHGTTSAEQMDFTLCMSPYDFGYVILQNAAMSAAQTAEKTAAAAKVFYITVASDNIAETGYVTMAVSALGESCTDSSLTAATGSQDALATWAVIQDVGSNAFATEIPTASATVNTSSGNITCSSGATTDCPGLFNNSALVLARYDVNAAVTSKTDLFVWLGTNGTLVGSAFVRNVSAILQCENESQISTTMALPHEVNVIDPSALVGIGQCTALSQNRGVVRFNMPTSGLAWSHISQASATYRMNFLAYSPTTNNQIP